MLANHCRANLLLEKQHHKLKKNPLWGIDVSPLAEDDFLKWLAVIKGPRHSIWESGIFKLYLTFNEEYDFKPPEIFFHTIPFHPNIDVQSGIPCVDFLDDMREWKQYDLAYILLSLQVMLDNPVLENPVNLQAARLLQSRPKRYKQMVLDSVVASKRLEAGLPPLLMSPATSEKQAEADTEDLKPTTKNRSKVSFEEYYKTWVRIATSRPDTLTQVQVGECAAADDLTMNETHFGVVRSDLEEELRKQMSEHNAVMYGRFRTANRVKDEERIAELQATKAQVLKQIYYRQHDSLSPTAPPITARFEDDDPGEEEVEKLVHWSKDLPS
eukprot:Seg1140.3 transcript_id=Seg1140.3/GoldUCD/mRNA.D3Y31 product="Ubiquitin-conjugating enzyme E2 U" protein_id=Seg1140.3/GoldUCD/D3Y31